MDQREIKTMKKTWLEFEEYKALKDWFKEKDNALSIYLQLFGAGKTIKDKSLLCKIK